jgi:hypothetical protein
VNGYLKTSILRFAAITNSPSPLKDVWDEFKYQIQEEQSPFFDFYEDTIRRLCAEAVTRQGREWEQLLWLWTEGYLDWWADQDEVSIDDFQTDDVVEEVYTRVCDTAANEPFATDPDEERHREQYAEDMDLFRSGSEDAGDDDSDPGDTR